MGYSSILSNVPIHVLGFYKTQIRLIAQYNYIEVLDFHIHIMFICFHIPIHTISVSQVYSFTFSHPYSYLPYSKLLQLQPHNSHIPSDQQLLSPTLTPQLPQLPVSHSVQPQLDLQRLRSRWTSATSNNIYIKTLKLE